MSMEILAFIRNCIFLRKFPILISTGPNNNQTPRKIKKRKEIIANDVNPLFYFYPRENIFLKFIRPPIGNGMQQRVKYLKKISIIPRSRCINTYKFTVYNSGSIPETILILKTITQIPPAKDSAKEIIVNKLSPERTLNACIHGGRDPRCTSRHRWIYRIIGSADLADES